MKLFIIHTTFALPIWYRLSNPGEGWENGNQFNSQLETGQNPPSSGYQTATMGGFLPSNGYILPSVGEPVISETVKVQTDGEQEVETDSDARIVSFFISYKSEDIIVVC